MKFKLPRYGKLAGGFGLLLALVLTMVLGIPAMAFPQVGHQFQGNVTCGGGQAPEGMDIFVTLTPPGGVETYYGDTVKVDASGQYGASAVFRIGADDTDPGITGGRNGDTIKFYFCALPPDPASVKADQESVFQIAGQTMIDLSATKCCCPEVGTRPAYAQTTTSHKLRGKLKSLGTATTVNVSFEWGTTKAYGNETTPQAMTTPGKFTFILDGLTPGTKYHFRAKAVAGDCIEYGNNSKFWAGEPWVKTRAADTITSTSAQLKGKLKVLGTATTVNVSYQWGTAKKALVNETTPQALTAPSQFPFILDGLAPNTKYWYRAKAVGDATDYGTKKSFTTLP